MLKYIFKRIIGAIPLLILITLISYAIIFFSPGDPTLMMINPRTPPQEIERIKANLGLDKPFYVQYGIWLKNLILRGELGYSLVNGRKVGISILERIPATLVLMGSAYFLSFILALPLGIFSSLKQNTFYDYLLTFFAFLGLSIPGFWLALMSIYFFSVKLGWFPALGSSFFEGGFWNNLLDLIKHLVLPVAVLTLKNLASWMRYIRASMIEILKENYIRTALAKGLSMKEVIYKHALRNALLPIITLMGLTLPDLISGAFIIEFIFSWPGMGRLGMEAVFHRDYPILMGDILFSSILVILGNLIADITYAWADPRIRLK
ncbi:MAG: ABC transporter permease [Armatimonadetes bacterium]|nr:ABC transporter permease [Armatimonadota bacterium]